MTGEVIEITMCVEHLLRAGLPTDGLCLSAAQVSEDGRGHQILHRGGGCRRVVTRRRIERLGGSSRAFGPPGAARTLAMPNSRRGHWLKAAGQVAEVLGRQRQAGPPGHG